MVVVEPGAKREGVGGVAKPGEAGRLTFMSAASSSLGTGSTSALCSGVGEGSGGSSKRSRAVKTVLQSSGSTEEAVEGGEGDVEEAEEEEEGESSQGRGVDEREGIDATSGPFGASSSPVVAAATVTEMEMPAEATASEGKGSGPLTAGEREEAEENGELTKLPLSL